jgi:SAM-dependent MidA family methyltransferase
VAGRTPPIVDGAVLMNEVLDAIPPYVVARIGGVWHERGVAAARDGGFLLADRAPVDPRLSATAGQRFPGAGDYASEINLAAEALVEDLGGDWPPARSSRSTTDSRGASTTTRNAAPGR